MVNFPGTKGQQTKMGKNFAKNLIVAIRRNLATLYKVGQQLLMFPHKIYIRMTHDTQKSD